MSHSVVDDTVLVDSLRQKCGTASNDPNKYLEIRCLCGQHTSQACNN